MSKKAAQIGELVDFLEQFTLTAQEASTHDASQLREFIGDGKLLHDQLIGVVHREFPAQEVDRRSMNRWFKFALKLQRSTLFAMRKAARTGS